MCLRVALVGAVCCDVKRQEHQHGDESAGRRGDHANGGALKFMALYEEEKRRIERNMLALSNLNLATSSFVGGEIQRMLAQALDRVLGVVRLPAGALFLHHGDPQGPTSLVAVGLNDDFCRVAQNEGLDDYLVSLVARLGGLLG